MSYITDITAILEALPEDATADEIYTATQAYSRRDVMAAMYALNAAGGGSFSGGVVTEGVSLQIPEGHNWNADVLPTAGSVLLPADTPSGYDIYSVVAPGDDPFSGSNMVNYTSDGHFTLQTAGLDVIVQGNDTSVAFYGDINLMANGRIIAATLTLQSLPTANPNVAGQIWNDAGTLKVSAG